MTKSAQNCSKLDPVFCFSKFLQLKSILDDFLYKSLITRENHSREKDKFHLKGLKSEDTVLGPKGKFLVIKSWVSKSGVRFLIRSIFDMVILLSPNLQKRTYAQEKILFIGTHWFLSQIHGIRSLFALQAPQGYQNFQRGVVSIPVIRG